MAQKSKHRGFPFTDYVLDESFIKNLAEHPSTEYLVAGEEICPTTGKTHWQSFIYLKNARTLKSMIKQFKPRHIEIMKPDSTPEKNREYCLKENKPIIEHGKCPKQGKRSDLEEIREAIAEGKPEREIAEMNFGQWCQYRRAFAEYKALVEPKRNWVTEVYFIWGESGVGKTRKAVEDGAKLIQYIPNSGFVLGYNGEDVVCFDDVDSGTFPRKWLLEATDRYSMVINVKGGERNWKPRKIYFTSNFAPEDLFPFNDPAMERRYTEIVHLKNGTEEMEQKYPHGNTVHGGTDLEEITTEDGII